MYKESIREKSFLACNHVFLTLVGLMVVIPMLYTIAVSLTPYAETLRRGGIIFWPTKPTLEYYAYVLSSSSPVARAYAVTMVVTAVGTAASLLTTILTSYALSKKYLPGRNLFMYLFFFTMLFSGGLIPTYLVVRNFGLVDKLAALIIPSLVSVYNMIVMKSFFTSIPESLEESAKLDGCNDIRVLFRIVLPVSMPAVATIGLFYAVSKWNMFFDAMIYVNNSRNYTLQVVLRQILVMSEMDALNPERAVVSPPILSLQMACTMIAVLPMMAVYPFVQRFFVKGVMIGSIKA